VAVASANRCIEYRLQPQVKERLSASTLISMPVCGRRQGTSTAVGGLLHAGARRGFCAGGATVSAEGPTLAFAGAGPSMAAVRTTGTVW